VPEGSTSRRSIVRTVDAVVVGAGFGGLYMLHRLRDLGLSVQGIEAGEGVGGTWYWNRYPGARCDLPSLAYSYNFSEDLRREWRWSERYSPQSEILRYAEHVADRFDLKPLIAFGARVTHAAFDDDAGVWTLETDRGDRIVARWCVMATGCLSIPQKPTLPGEETFKGTIYHTAAWPHEQVELGGLSVGVIGTGSSGIQSIPVIAEAARRVTVFQRTPNFSVPSRNGPLSDAEIAEFRAAYPEYLETLRNSPGLVGAAEGAPIPSEAEQQQAYERLWGAGGPSLIAAFPNLFTSVEVNDGASEFVRRKIAEVVDDPAVAAVLQPHDHPIGTKRICVDSDYYQTYNRPNVELVDLRRTPIEAITPTGLRTTEREYSLDVLVFATGFDAISGALLAIDIRGSGGARLKDAWANGPLAYLGMTVAGFPNLFTITGPGSPSVLSNMIPAIEQHVDWIADCIGYMREKGYRRIAGEPSAQAAWMAHVQAVADSSLFPRANSWYVGANIPGKPRLFTTYIGAGYRAKCDEVAARGYEGFVLA